MTRGPSTVNYKSDLAYTRLSEKEILEGIKRVHELYPLSNVKFSTLFPILKYCMNKKEQKLQNKSDALHKSLKQKIT